MPQRLQQDTPQTQGFAELVTADGPAGMVRGGADVVETVKDDVMESGAGEERAPAVGDASGGCIEA